MRSMNRRLSTFPAARAWPAALWVLSCLSCASGFDHVGDASEAGDDFHVADDTAGEHEGGDVPDVPPDADDAADLDLPPDAPDGDDGPEVSDDATDDTAPPVGDCAVLGAWTASEPFADDSHVSHPLPSFAVGSWYYVHTMAAGGGERILYSAQARADGTLGPWQEASPDHGGGPHGFTAIAVGADACHFRNGHIARYRFTADGHMDGDVELLESDVGTAYIGERYVWDTAVWAPFGSGSQYVFHLGGFSFVPYAYRQHVLRNGVPMAASFTDTGLEHPNERPGKSAFFGPAGLDRGYIFSGASGGSRLWRAEAHADGSISGWTEMTGLPAGTGNERGDLFVARRTLFSVRGSRVFRSALDDAGGMGDWQELPALPEDQIDVSWGDGHLEGASSGVIAGFAYVTGPKRVYWAPIVPSACSP